MERDRGDGELGGARSSPSGWWSSIVTRSQPTGRAISLFLDIGQGAGLATATGVRPFLPPLLAGALARGGAGIDFDDGGFAFLESSWFLLAVLVLAVAAYALERSGRGGAAAGAVVLGASIGLAALLFAGSLSEGGRAGWPGLLAGAACAGASYAGVAVLVRRTRRRLADQGRGFLTAYADVASLVCAALAVLLPPAGFLLVGCFALLLLRLRSAEGEKYEGLRTLR